MDGARIIHTISRLRDRITADMAREYEARGLKGVAPAHGGVLYALGRGGPAVMNDLAEALERDNSTITTLVDKLQKGGYVKRMRSPEDGRAFLVQLTAKGREARGKVISVSRMVLTRIYRGLEVGERRELVRLLRHVYENFD